MKDFELRGVVLKLFFERRREPIQKWNESHVPPEMTKEDFMDICRQLGQHDLISWKPHSERINPDPFGGSGRITARGVDVIEGTVTSPIAIQITNHSVSVTNSTIGSLSVANGDLAIAAATVALNSAIQIAARPESEKVEAKQLWERIVENPILAAFIGGLVQRSTP